MQRTVWRSVQSYPVDLNFVTEAVAMEVKRSLPETTGDVGFLRI